MPLFVSLVTRRCSERPPTPLELTRGRALGFLRAKAAPAAEPAFLTHSCGRLARCHFLEATRSAVLGTNIIAKIQEGSQTE
jgi:hypothetical protein